jgi:hypothetical protein
MDSTQSFHDTHSTKWAEWLRTHGFAELFDIKENCAHPFDQPDWSPCKADRLAAWKLYTQLRTRITTQPLAYRAGDEAAALDSIYRLFDISRTIITEHQGCTHFATLTIRVLNERVRPFTAKWHRMAVDGALASADVRFLFRRELAALQPSLRTFTRLLGLIAGDDPHVVEAEAAPTVPTSNAMPKLWDPLPCGIAAGTRGIDASRDAINTKEAEEISARRNFYGLHSGYKKSGDHEIDAVGLAISGGGIRSATFALGIIQQLARKGILCQVDYLSTVSGGGYLGSFISSFLCDSNHKISLKAEPGSLPFGREGDGESQSVRHLRNHSKYLSEGGVRTYATMAVLAAYGVLVSVLLVAPLLLAGVLVAALLFKNSFGPPPPGFIPLSTITETALFLLAVSVVVLPLVQNFSRGSSLQRQWERACVAFTVASVVLLIGEALPHLFFALHRNGAVSRALIYATSFPFVLGAVGLWLGAESRLGRLVFALFGITGPFLMLATFFWLAESFIANPSHPSIVFLAVLTTFVTLYASFVVNINFASPHLFYRNRLARTYLTRSANGGAEVKPCDPQKLSAMNAAKKAPYHLINCALNIPSCTDPNLRGRNTDFFLFSKHYCGSPITGFQQTTDWETMDSHLDLGTAMAISGAAAAPHMGTLTAARYTFLLAMLNVRLGYWLHRPRLTPSGRFERCLPPVGWLYFVRELTGMMSEKTRYLNLSDGGHIENLGIYELLRRRCKFIIAIDGEADPTRSFGGLLTLTQLATIDLGVNIEPDLADLRMDRDGHGRAHFGLARIDYPDGNYGLLLYIKSSLTGNESEFLKKYRAENPDFPHQSTAQQLFSETQFEAYRSLGEHIAQDLFRSDLVGDWQHTMPVRQWFESLAMHLL